MSRRRVPTSRTGRSSRGLTRSRRAPARPPSDAPSRATRATRATRDNLAKVPRESKRPQRPQRPKRSKRPAGPKVARETGAARRSSRARRVLFVGLATVSALVIVASGVEWTLRSPLFRVRHVSFVGLRHETPAAVLAASGLATDPPIIDVSAASIDARLARFPWVQAVSVTKHWPNRVVVRVTERSAVAVAYAPGHVLVYVDAAGHDLGAAPRAANLPTLVYEHPRAATWPFLVAGRAAAYVASQLPPAFSSQVSTISVNAAGDVTLAMTTPVRFVLGPATNLHAKWVSIAAVIAHARLAPGDVVDVSVPGSLAVTGGAPS